MQLDGASSSLPAQVVSGLFLALFLIIGFFVLYMIFRTLLYICPPNEALIFSGRKHSQSDGSVRGFRVVFGGRGWRVPIFERVDRMNLNTFEVPISIRGAYSQGGIALNVEAVANVKVSSEQGVIGNAIERFLGQPPTAISKVSIRRHSRAPFTGSAKTASRLLRCALFTPQRYHKVMSLQRAPVPPQSAVPLSAGQFATTAPAAPQAVHAG